MHTSLQWHNGASFFVEYAEAVENSGMLRATEGHFESHDRHQLLISLLQEGKY